MRIGIVAGEASGDLLGAGLIKAIKQRRPDVVFEGVGGPEMIAAGCRSLFPMETLSVMGLFEVLGRLFAILNIRRKLYKHFIKFPPDVFIGIDSPDFNLPLEKKLRKKGILTVHYNSPTVWAWRENRWKGIAKSTDLMLTLFPFEASFYEQKGIPVCFVGHPLADLIPKRTSQSQAREQLGIAAHQKVIALLPGSRASEIKRLGPLFIKTVEWCLARNSDVLFVAPMVNALRRQQFQAMLDEYAPTLPITLIDGQSRLAMAASDVVLLASGTATLEALLLHRPMVVSYCLSPLTYQIAKRLIKIKQIALPNLLSQKTLAPEFIQERATPDNLGDAVLERLNNDALIHDLTTEYDRIHEALRCNASERAADAVLNFFEGSS